MRQALRGLDARNAERVAAHLVAAGTLVDEAPEEALAHARAARDRASRMALVREAVGVAAYHAGDYAEAARELRAYRRMSGDPGYRAVLADCERALGRPEVALRLVREALAEQPDPEEVVELRLVEAGARRDLGELPAARLVLEGALGGRPRPDAVDLADPGVLRLAAAYADLLDVVGDPGPAGQWHAAVAAHAPEESDVEFGEEEHPPGAGPAPGADGASADAPEPDRTPSPDADAPDADAPDADAPDADAPDADAPDADAPDADASDADAPPSGGGPAVLSAGTGGPPGGPLFSDAGRPPAAPAAVEGPDESHEPHPDDIEAEVAELLGEIDAPDDDRH